MQRYSSGSVHSHLLNAAILTMTVLDRRILCDRTTPTCLQCSRSKRKCKGYGVRLSWPTAIDGRRSAVVNARSCMNEVPTMSNAHLVNMTFWDVQMHYHLTAELRNGKLSLLSPVWTRTCEGADTALLAYARPTLDLPLPWNPLKLDVGDKDLLQYCMIVHLVFKIARV
jgi:hypothetical protein